MAPALFAALDREWQTVCSSRLADRARSQWTDDALRRFSNLTDLIATLRRSRHNPDAADAILAALARRAPADELAARTLLQAVLPGLFNVAKRLGHGWVDDDLEAEVLGEAVARIRTYPIERRPRLIAANITWDVFGAISRRRKRAARVVLEPVANLELRETTAASDPSSEVCELIHDALERGSLRETDACLLLAIAVGHDTIGGRAQREGIAYDAMNERWRRARNRLRLAVAA
jgi:hypothetical protein